MTKVMAVFSADQVDNVTNELDEAGYDVMNVTIIDKAQFAGDRVFAFPYPHAGADNSFPGSPGVVVTEEGILAGDDPESVDDADIEEAVDYLKDQGVPHEEAEYYGRTILDGAVMFIVDTEEDEVPMVESIMREAGAQNLTD